MAQDSETGELMKSNRVMGVGGLILPAVFAMGTAARASVTTGPGMDGASSFAAPVLAGLVLAILPLIRKRRS
jgi:hypothetical protein